MADLTFLALVLACFLLFVAPIIFGFLLYVGIMTAIYPTIVKRQKEYFKKLMDDEK